MQARRLGVSLVLVLSLAGSVAALRQSPPSEGASARVWEGRHAEFEEFIRTTPFERVEDVPVGVTRPQRAYFAPGGLVASAAWKALPPGRAQGYWESYRSEIAAYELDKLLEMDMVPPTVEKRWKGDLGAAVLWLEGVRTYKEIEKLAKPERWNLQAIRMKMFDNFIGNIDRNQGNLLIDGQWNLFLIDHSRAFVTGTRLPTEMQRVDRELWAKFLALDEPALQAAIGKWVGRGSVRAMLRRRDKMAAVIETLPAYGSQPSAAAWPTASDGFHLQHVRADQRP